MRALLDINVLLALLDHDHIQHERAKQWLNGEMRQVTDLHLLGLAALHGGRFVTFGRALAPAAVRVARAANLVVL